MAAGATAALLALPVVLLGTMPAMGRVDPLNFIKRQIHKPNLLIVLDTSGSMTGVPGQPFRSSSEVGVDCDNGHSCRGWQSRGACRITPRVCDSDADCVAPYCTLGNVSCAVADDCPSQGECNLGGNPCSRDADCAAFGYGTCGLTGDSCNSEDPCPEVGQCSVTGNRCTRIGRGCSAGYCSNDASRVCTVTADCPVASTGSCSSGLTPAGGCRVDGDCPPIRRCSTGEGCTADADCPLITVGRCSRSGASCRVTADCPRRNDRCDLPSNRCGDVSNTCQLPSATCNLVPSAQNRCERSDNECRPAVNACNITVWNECRAADPADRCDINAIAGAGAIKMCQRAMSLCTLDSDCPSDDVCGAPTSRTVVAKRTLSRVIEQNHRVVNLGLMTFYQNGYFPYYEVTGVRSEDELIFLSRTQLGTTCFSLIDGPSNTCTRNGTLHRLAVGANSTYRVNILGTPSNVDHAWCGEFCAIPGSGTGQYQGSWYVVRQGTGTVTNNLTRFPEYTGKNITDNGTTYRYYDSNPAYYNGGPAPPISTISCGSVCSDTCGARWDEQLSPVINPNQTDDEAREGALSMLERMAPASFGGLVNYGGTPSGCTLMNAGVTTKNRSAYHYMKDVKDSDTLGCRQNYVLFITDGEANGPGDSSCTAAACSAANPETAGCRCRVVLSAFKMRRDLGVRTFVVGFSTDVAFGDPRIINDNVARAGGTDAGNDGVAPYAFVATNEQELTDAIQGAIFDAVRGSYSTAPSSSSSGEQLPGSIKAGRYALDARVDFPSWGGRLIAYDTETDPPVIAWEAAEEMSRVNWWERRVYVGARDGSVVKVLVDPNTKVVRNRDTLFQMGLGASPDEAEAMMKFALGDPESGNRAPLGAMVNSTPIDVASPGDSPLPGGHDFFVTYKNRPHLTYVGASDGMLHAFFTETTTVGGVEYPGGYEAFAYIPPGMLNVLEKLYTQRGQFADPKQHIFGLASSAKVKNLCVRDCTDAATAIWKTVLVMNEGYGGSGLFVLDVTNPLSSAGFAEPPVVPLWHSNDPDLARDYSDQVGLTTSVPAFVYHKDDGMADHRLLLASGYGDGAQTGQRRIVSASVTTGEILDSATAPMSGDCTQEYAILADVATARNFGAGEHKKVRAAYVGDTWGALWRHDDRGLYPVANFGCRHPLHFAPTIVQLDRDDPGNRVGEAYLVQVTNSSLDDATATLGPSKLVIMKEIADAEGRMQKDDTFGTSGVIEMVVGQDSLCAVTDDLDRCTQRLPENARPTATPMAILKKDGSGFKMMTMWYAQDLQGCSKGQTWLTLHEVQGQTVSLEQALKVGDEPVTSPVIVGGKIFVVGSGGTIEISGSLQATFSTGVSTPQPDLGGGLYEQLSWTELP
jgi:hypothetical protein